jgi:steroid 5-alpha reductase family enzyme
VWSALSVFRNNDLENKNMSFISIYGFTLLILLGLMVVLWLVSLALKNASIVDIFWGTGFIISGWLYFAFTPDGFLQRKLLLALLVTVWGLRLSLHILWRNAGKGEDYRYQVWRRQAGAHWWWRSLFKVFLLQGILMGIISTPLLAAQFFPGPGRLTVFDILGVALWLVGFFFEAVGDLQLARFRADPANKGSVMTAGVWRLTRHPNYFGDTAQWWGYFLIAAAAGGWWTVFSPLLMTLFLLRVSGVSLLEKTLAQRPGYEAYMKTTSAFIPWFPQKKT